MRMCSRWSGRGEIVAWERTEMVEPVTGNAKQKNWVWHGFRLGGFAGLIAGTAIYAILLVIHPVGKDEAGLWTCLRYCAFGVFCGGLPGLVVGGIVGFVYGLMLQAIKGRPN
jgi:hypothetical protein